MQFTTLNAEADGDEVRVETLNENEYLVAPVVLVREGVLNGGYLGFDEIQKSVPGWNGEPLTAPPDEGTQAAQLAPDEGVSGHPIETNDDGEAEFVSANQMPFIEDMQVGFLANVEADKDIRGLKGEAWANAERVTQVGEQAVEAAQRIAEGDPLDVSTGYFHRPVRTQGRHEGEQYEVVQKDLLPDHLALLPNERGACSWADGCGVPRVNSLLDPTSNADTDDPRFRDRVLGVLGLDDEAELETESGGCGCGCHGDCAEANEDEDEDADEDADTAANASDETTETTTETMTDHDIETLAERSAFDAETLDEWDEDDLAALAETVEDDADGDAHDDDEPNGAANADDGDAGTDDADDALREQVEALTETVEALKADLNESEREQAVNEVVAHTEYDRETVESLDDEALETLAEDLPEDGGAATGNAGHPQGDRVNYVGQGTGSPTPDEDETQELTENVGALASMNGDD